MSDNVDQLPAVALLARETGVGEISVHPVIRRDLELIQFASELNGNGDIRPKFASRLLEAAARTREAFPAVNISIARNRLEPNAADIRSPEGLTTCEQNPWETIHIPTR